MRVFHEISMGLRVTLMLILLPLANLLHNTIMWLGTEDSHKEMHT